MPRCCILGDILLLKFPPETLPGSTALLCMVLEQVLPVTCDGQEEAWISPLGIEEIPSLKQTVTDLSLLPSTKPGAEEDT
jgi:hypothetical protein